MKQSTTSERLKDIMARRKLRQVDILELAKPYCERFGVKLGKNDLSQYVSGKVEPGQEKLTVLGLALNVNEAWLMGYDVPIVRGSFTTCPVCGMQSLLLRQIRSPLSARDFGFFLTAPMDSRFCLSIINVVSRHRGTRQNIKNCRRNCRRKPPHPA